MPIVAQIVCDNCEAVKKDTDPWYAISFENNSFCLKTLALPADWATKNFPESSIQYSYDRFRAVEALNFCGHFCAVEALTQWVNKLSDETELFPMNAKDAPIGAPIL